MKNTIPGKYGEANGIHQNYLIPNSVQGCHIIAPDRTDQLNARIQLRAQTDIPLAPVFDSRPEQTKYTHYSDNYNSDPYRDKPSVPIHQDMYPAWKASPFHSCDNQPFTAPTRNGPALAYYSNIDTETAIQRQGAYMFNTRDGHDASIFVPSANSDMYEAKQAYLGCYSGGGGAGAADPCEFSPYLTNSTLPTQSRKVPAALLNGQTQMPFGNPTQCRAVLM